MSRESYRYPLRLPLALLDAVRAQAEEQKVSVNTLLVALIAGGMHFELPEEPR
jgi:hypothetical protein